ncbi:hypothetical protein D3C78_598270 [compost metagenome]
MIQLTTQGHLGGDAPVAVVVHQIQLGAQHLAAIRAGAHQIPIGIQGEGDRAAVAAVFAVQALLDGVDIELEAVGGQGIGAVAHGEAHIAHHGSCALIALGQAGAGHGADHRVGAIADGDAQGGRDFVAVRIGQGEARQKPTVCAALIQRLVQGEDVVAGLIQRQREDVLTVDAAADAVAADADDHGCATAGEALQARLAGIECDVDQGVGTCGDGKIPGEDLGRAPVAVFRQGEGDGIDLRQGAVGDGDVEGAEVALVAVKVAALHLQPQVDAVAIDRLIQHAIKLHMVLAVQIQGDGQHRLATRIQQGDLVAINLIAGRLAAAGEAVQAGLIGLEVEGHQAIAAHVNRQLTVQGLAGPALLQADAGV